METLPNDRRRLFTVALVVASVGLFLQLAVNLTGGYGIFRDELYYLACSHHLDWGYVDQPPLSILILAGVRSVLGESIFALRLVPALAFAGLILLAGALVEALGGGWRASLVATVSVLVTPVYLGICGIYSMNALDLVAWAACLLVLVQIARGGSERLWLVFGLLAGISLQNKISLLFLGVGLLVGLLLTPHRRHLLSRWLWAGVAVAALLALPYGLWQLAHDFATLEFMHNAARYKNAPTDPVGFFMGQILNLHPLNAPIWLAGLLYLLLARPMRPFRLLGLAYLAVFAVFALGNGKAYYLAAYYPVLFAAGGIAIERLASRRRLGFMPSALVGVLLVGGAFTLPYALPVLAPESFIAYTKKVGIDPGGEERDRPSAMGQHYADMFGWKELAEDVATVYRSLPPEEQKGVILFGQNYGQAGAIDHFGPALGLPHAISGHNNYWIWGPGEHTGKVAIIIGGDAEENASVFESCQVVAVHRSRYARSFETDLPITVCRGPRVDLETLWPTLRHYI